MNKCLRWVLAAGVLTAVSLTANATLIPFRVDLTGAGVFPGPGDPDGYGTALLIFDNSTDLVYWSIPVANIGAPVAFDIHLGAAGSVGPQVFNFFGSQSGSSNVPGGVDALLANPDLYVDVHTGDYPAGAIRGQLESAAAIPFSATLTGASEVPGPGDPNGSGIALFNFDASINRTDWVIVVENVGPVIGADIRLGPAGSVGPSVYFINAIQIPIGAVIGFDVTGVLANPANFYVNVYNADFPAGAVRGQLVAPAVVPEPSTVALLATALVGLALARRRRS